MLCHIEMLKIMQVGVYVVQLQRFYSKYIYIYKINIYFPSGFISDVLLRTYLLFNLLGFFPLL